MFLSLFWITCVFWSLALSSDPCEEALDTSNIKREQSHTLSFEDTAICDDGLDFSKWYKFGGNLTRHCVGTNQCGTSSGIWVSGSHPKGDEIVTAKACAGNLVGECCSWKHDIKIKKCGSSFVYQLAKVDSCPMAYCVGNKPLNDLCRPNQVIAEEEYACLDVPPIENPKLGQPYISAWKRVMVDNTAFNATIFSVDCEVDAGEGLEKYTSHGSLMMEIEFKMDETTIETYVGELKIKKITVNESKFMGNLGKNLSCSVRLFYNLQTGGSSSKTLWKKSQAYYMGIIPTDIHGKKIEVLKVDQGKVETVFLRPTFPITLGHCFGQQRCDSTEYVFNLEPSSTRIQLKECQAVLKTKMGESIFPEINLSVQTSFGVESSKAFINFQQYSHPTARTLFQNYTIPAIPIVTEDFAQRPACRSVGDPHFSSFQNVVFDNYQIGDYNLISSPDRNFQVQVRHIPCGGGRATCSCGIIAREENSVMGISACDNLQTPLIFELMTDNINPSIKISKEGSSYIMEFPSGVIIKVDPYQWSGKAFMNIYVYGLKQEVYGGICAAKQSPNFDSLKIEGSQSFFQMKPLSCVNEISKFPTCNCCLNNTRGKPEQNGQLTCCNVSPETNVNIIKLGKVCDLKTHRERQEKRTTDTKIDLVTVEVEGNKGFDIGNILGSVDPKRDFENTDINNIDKSVADKECTEVFKGSPMYAECSDLLKDEMSNLYDNCMADIQLSGTIDVGTLYINVFERMCHQTVERKIAIKDGEKSAADQKFIEIADRLGRISCGTCHNGGKCVNGSCVCSQGFGGHDCFHNLNAAPIIKFFHGGSYRDMTAQSWNLINLQYSNILVIFGNLITGVVDFQDKESDKWLNISTSVTIDDSGYLQIELNKNFSNTTSGQKSVAHVIVQIVTKNDLKIMESNKLNLTIFDGVCMSCSENGCTQKTTACNINNVCYKAMHVFNDEFICNPQNSTTNWSRKGPNETPISLMWIIILIIICGTVVIIATMWICYFVVKKYKIQQEYKVGFKNRS